MSERIAFDLDETLGVPIIEGTKIVGFQWRRGCLELLKKLCNIYEICLWSVGSRQYVDQVLSFGLNDYFIETYSWDELPCTWKDVRKLRIDYLIDDSEHHRQAAKNYGLTKHYIVIPAYGSPEDVADPMLWVKKIEQVLLDNPHPSEHSL
jgi:hypothetical protein